MQTVCGAIGSGILLVRKLFLHSTFLDQLVKTATNDSTEEACECILEYYTSIICGSFCSPFL